MIISTGRRYIFVHAPKTGGTSLALALEAHAMKDDILIGDTPKARRRRRRLAGLRTAGRLWKHSTLAEAEGLVTQEMCEEFLVFTLVRNPWDRMVSYYHWLREQRFEHPAVALARSCDFRAFAAHPQTVTAFSARPYRSYVTDARGVERGIFVRLEHLRRDLAPVEAHLGFRVVPGHVNRSRRPADYRKLYDERAAAAVAEACAEDIVRFGYRFDDPGRG